DPLIPYGAVNHLLPGRSAEASIAFRDVVMRWQLPHISMFWMNLEEGINRMCQLRPSYEDLWTYGEANALQYSLGVPLLEPLAHHSLAITQILNGLNDFRELPSKNTFLLDPNWQLLRLMELHRSRNTVLMALSSLQLRFHNASRVIRKFLHSAQITYADGGLDAVSSADSTRSSVRSEFGREEPRVELAKLLARPDYAA
ncbi:hypothetical protein C8R46DRAFT_854705, partial [Mycena filopes]